MVFKQPLVSNLKPHCFHLDSSLKRSTNIPNLLSQIPTQSSLVNSELFFFLLSIFFFPLDSDKDAFDDKSDDDGSGSGFTSGSCLSLLFELSVDHVSGLSFNVVTTSVCSVCGIFSVSRSKNSLVSSSEFLI